MKTSLRLLATATGAWLFVLTAARAESDSAQNKNSDAGLLGHNYASFDVGVDRIRDSAKPNGFLGGGDVNLQIDDGFDYHLNGGYEHASNSKLKVSGEAVDNALTYYYRSAAATPFLSAGFGYGWNKTTVVHTSSHSNAFTFGAATGVEVPFGTSTAVRLGLDYDQATRHHEGRAIGYDVVANHWFNETVGTTIGAKLRQGRNGVHDALQATAGVQLRFD